MKDNIFIQSSECFLQARDTETTSVSTTGLTACAPSWVEDSQSCEEVRWAGRSFWDITGQASWSWAERVCRAPNPGDSWCICMWAAANLVAEVRRDEMIGVSCVTPRWAARPWSWTAPPRTWTMCWAPGTTGAGISAILSRVSDKNVSRGRMENTETDPRQQTSLCGLPRRQGLVCGNNIQYFRPQINYLRANFP